MTHRVLTSTTVVSVIQAYGKLLHNKVLHELYLKNNSFFDVWVFIALIYQKMWLWQSVTHQFLKITTFLTVNKTVFDIHFAHFIFLILKSETFLISRHKTMSLNVAICICNRHFKLPDEKHIYFRRPSYFLQTAFNLKNQKIYSTINLPSTQFAFTIIPKQRTAGE